MEMIVLKTFENYFSANIILGRLQQEGVQCYLKDEYTVTIDPILSNAIGGIKLVVAAPDVPLANMLLKNFEEEYLRSVECPKCGGHDINLISKPGAGNFITAILTWLFSSYAIAPNQLYQCQQCGYESATLPENNTVNN